MRTTTLVLLLAACTPQGSGKVPSTGLTTTTPPTPFGDTDTDTDTDADADADADADSDTDADTDTPTGTTGSTGTTADTGPYIPAPLPPDHLVDCNGGGDFTTIQAAIDAAVSGERIGVEPCIYAERIDFIGKSVDVYGTGGSAVTFINGQLQGSVVNIENGESDGTRLAGFTIYNGEDDDDGSAIQIEEAHVELDDLVLRNNGTSFSVIYALVGLVDMDNVVIYDNDILVDGQAVFSDGGGLTATDVDIDCSGGLTGIYHHNVMILTDSTVTCTGGYGVDDYHGEDQIRRSSLYGGIAGIYAHDTESTVEEPDTPNELFVLWNSVVGGGAYGADVRYMDLDIGNSVFYGGDSALTMTLNLAGGSAISSVFRGATCGVTGDQAFTITSSSFYDNATDGCGLVVAPSVTTDPLFVAWPTDLHLQAGSPLIDAGSPLAIYDDTDGTRNDIGVYGGPMPLP